MVSVRQPAARRGRPSPTEKSKKAKASENSETKPEDLSNIPLNVLQRPQRQVKKTEKAKLLEQEKAERRSKTAANEATSEKAEIRPKAAANKATKAVRGAKRAEQVDDGPREVRSSRGSKATPKMTQQVSDESKTTIQTGPIGSKTTARRGRNVSKTTPTRRIAQEKNDSVSTTRISMAGNDATDPETLSRGHTKDQLPPRSSVRNRSRQDQTGVDSAKQAGRSARRNPNKKESTNQSEKNETATSLVSPNSNFVTSRRKNRKPLEMSSKIGSSSIETPKSFETTPQDDQLPVNAVEVKRPSRKPSACVKENKTSSRKVRQSEAEKSLIVQEESNSVNSNRRLSRKTKSTDVGNEVSPTKRRRSGMLEGDKLSDEKSNDAPKRSSLSRKKSIGQLDCSKVVTSRVDSSKIPIYFRNIATDSDDVANKDDDIYSLPVDPNACGKKKKRVPRRKKVESKSDISSVLARQKKNKAVPSKQTARKMKLASQLKADGYHLKAPTKAEAAKERQQHCPNIMENRAQQAFDCDDDGGLFDGDHFDLGVDHPNNVDDCPPPGAQPSTSKEAPVPARKKFQKTPRIPKRVDTRAIEEGKVSTPRLEQDRKDVERPQRDQHRQQQVSLIEEKKSCFGFDDTDESMDGDVSQASVGGGFVTLSDISPVKRSSLLPPPSHYITMMATPSTSTMSVTNEFAKPLSARPQRFNLNFLSSKSGVERSGYSAQQTSFTSIKQKQAFEAPLPKGISSKAGACPTGNSTTNKENEVTRVLHSTVADPEKKKDWNAEKQGTETKATVADKKVKKEKKKALRNKVILKRIQTLIPEAVENLKWLNSKKKEVRNRDRQPEPKSDIADPIDGVDKSQSEARAMKSPSKGEPSRNFSAASKKPAKTYERKSFLEAKKSPVKTTSKRMVDVVRNDWESFQTSHFSQIEEFDLVFK